MENDKKTSLLQKWKNKVKQGEQASALEKAPAGAHIPLSSGQKRLWFLQQLYPENPFYNYSETYTFKGNLNLDYLIISLKKTYQTHDILRTIYLIENDTVVQKIDDTSEIDIQVHNFSALPLKTALAEAKNVQKVDATKHFNLDTSPLVRAAIIKISDTYHILQITLHHIATDKWSMRLFREDMACFYSELLSNKTLSNRRTQLQYADYCYWINKQPIDEKALVYWKNKLSGEIPSLSLPFDFQRPHHPSFKGAASFTQHFSESTSNKLLQLSQELQTTPYNVMLACYYVLLHKLSGQTDILIGTPITNRDKKTLENLIGFFNDTIVLRAHINTDLTFIDFVKHIKNNTLEAFENKNIPFDILVKKMGVKRSLALNPFFQVMFLYHSKPTNPSFGNDLEFSHTWFDSEVSKFDLTIYVGEEEGILSSTFEYAHDLFKESTIHGFQEYFKRIVETVCSNPNITLKTMDILSETKENIVNPKNVSHFNTNNKGIHNLIEDVTNKHPNKTAVTYNNISLTYEVLNKKANNLAQRIIKITSGSNAVVGLCAERHTDMIVGLLGILKAGCCYLPIDPAYPKERTNFILEDSKTSLVITQSHLAKTFNENKITCINLENLSSSETNDVENTLPIVKREDLAYIIYTSGSTGKPKGVPISHKNIMNSTLGRLDFYNNNPKAFLLLSSIAFDSSKAGIFWILCTGGNLVISEKHLEQDIAAMSDVINTNNVSHTLMLPTVYNLVLEYANVNKLKSLDTVIVAGESCSVSVCKKHFKKLPEVNLYNEYGPTEATVWCTAHKIKPNDLEFLNIPIGKPVANSKIHILDSNLKQVPIDMVGEIYIGGPGLANGYLNREDLTNKAFIVNPFKSDEKLYKTGDLGKYNHNGTIHFLGRKDEQIKIRGYRVELSEIENAIKSYTNTISNAVVVLNNSSTNKTLDIRNLTNEDYVTIFKGYNESEFHQLIHTIKSLSATEKQHLLNQL